MEYEIIGLEKVDKEWLDKRPNLKCLGCNCTGTDHVDKKELERRGIKFISLQGHTAFLKYITSTAEHTFGLILALLRNYKEALDSKERPIGHTLSGKTLGIIGFGRIGKQVKKIAEGFGVKILTCNKEPRIFLDKLLKESDIVTIHIPLEGNIGYFTKEMFKLMKPTAYLINTSRDKVIEEGALLWALENKVIVGAGIDFIDDEGLVKYSKMYDNLIITNHIGGNTYEDTQKTRDFIEKLVVNYLTN